MNLLSASQSTVCGLAWKRYSRQTPLRDVAPALNGRASLARVRPCRTDAASFMVARARGRARRRASRAQQAGKLETRALFAGSQGGTVTRAGGNTCGPPSPRLDLRARGPAVGYGTIYLTGIDANGKVARASTRRRGGATAGDDRKTHAAAWLRLCPSQRRPRHTGRYRLGSATRTSGTPCATPSCRRIGSRTSGVETARDPK